MLKVTRGSPGPACTSFERIMIVCGAIASLWLLHYVPPLRDLMVWYAEWFVTIVHVSDPNEDTVAVGSEPILPGLRWGPATNGNPDDLRRIGTVAALHIGWAIGLLALALLLTSVAIRASKTDRGRAGSRWLKAALQVVTLLLMLVLVADSAVRWIDPSFRVRAGANTLTIPVGVSLPNTRPKHVINWSWGNTPFVQVSMQTSVGVHPPGPNLRAVRIYVAPWITALTGAFMLWLAMRGPMTRRRRWREVRCVPCGYDLRGATVARCPECAAPIPPAQFASGRRSENS